MPGIAEEYRIVLEGAAWIDRSSRGRVSVDGPDAGAFLHALLTNDITSLRPGQGVYAAYLTPNGRMIADMNVYRRPDRVVIETEPGMAPALAARLDQLVFAENVQIADVSAATSQIAIAGTTAIPELARVMDIDREALGALTELAQLGRGTTAAGAEFVVRSQAAAVPIFTVFGPAASRTALLSALADAGVPQVSEALLEVLRIEAGRGRFGLDMTEETIPLEAGLLDRAISTSKGCYVGQEVIIRVLHRGGGRVAKRLVTLSAEPKDAAPLAAGAVLSMDGKDVGHITSAVRSPRLGAIALAFVHRDAAVEGRVLHVAGSDGVTLRITGFAA